MRHTMYKDDDGNTVDELDAEHMMDGLRELLHSEPGTVLSTPVVISDEDGIPEAVAERRLVRLSDADADSS